VAEAAGRAAGSWLRRFRRGDEPVTARVICFPHAGGWPGYYQPWAHLLPADVDHVVVHYPGRESRADEACVTDMDTLVEAVVDAIKPLRDLPLVLFGHSMGGAVAHETALRLQAAGAPPAHLIVSGRRSPTVHRDSAFHLLDDDSLLAYLRTLDGIADEVLELPELRDLILEPLRSDYRLIETYEPSRPSPLLCPLTVVRGAEDPHCSRADAHAWQAAAGNGVTHLTFPGGHFYLAENHTGLVRHILALVAGLPGYRTSTSLENLR
jgi:pyochelin biosynthetic protein PchC